MENIYTSEISVKTQEDGDRVGIHVEFNGAYMAIVVGIAHLIKDVAEKTEISFEELFFDIAKVYRSTEEKERENEKKKFSVINGAGIVRGSDDTM